MDDVTWKGIPYSFILGVIAMLLTFWGAKEGTFNPEVFTDVMYGVLGLYGVTSGTRKIAGAIAAKAAVPVDKPTTTGAAG